MIAPRTTIMEILDLDDNEENYRGDNKNTITTIIIIYIAYEGG